MRYRYQFRSTFKGERGITSDGTAANVNNPNSYVFSLAPGIGYNWNEFLTFTVGAWFSVVGKNANAFASGIATVYYLF